jgi:hypothetical protein
LLDKLKAGKPVELKSGAIQRPYLTDPKLEMATARSWLKLKPEDKRGTKLHVRGGMDFLVNTAPSYTTLLAATGATQLYDLWLQPVALINPAGNHEDAQKLAQRLGFSGGAPTTKRAQNLLPGSSTEAVELARAAQQKLATMLDLLNAERSHLSEELTGLRHRHTEALVELATLRETTRAETAALRESTRVELMRAAQARMTAEEETTQTNARLEQLRAEIDDRIAESKRLQDLLNVAEGDRKNLLVALDASESERQQLAAASAAATAEAQAREQRRQDLAAAPRSLLPALSVGAAATVQADGSFAVKGQRGGCICYGPYLDLGAGTYQLELDFKRPALAGLLPSKAIVEVVDGNRFLFSSQVKLGGGRTSKTLTFDVPESDQPRQVEFRILVKRNSFVILRDSRLEARG